MEENPNPRAKFIYKAQFLKRVTDEGLAAGLTYEQAGQKAVDEYNAEQEKEKE